MQTTTATSWTPAIRVPLAQLLRRLGLYATYTTIHDNMSGRGIARLANGPLVYYTVANGHVSLDGHPYSLPIK